MSFITDRLKAVGRFCKARVMDMTEQEAGQTFLGMIAIVIIAIVIF